MVLITLVALIFLLSPQSIESLAKGIAGDGLLMEGGTSQSARQPKVIRSYRLVFRRRWRIFRIQNWRIPLPGGLELRAVGYWLACMAALALAARLPGLGLLLGALPPSASLRGPAAGGRLGARQRGRSTAAARTARSRR